MPATLENNANFVKKPDLNSWANYVRGTHRNNKRDDKHKAITLKFRYTGSLNDVTTLAPVLSSSIIDNDRKFIHLTEEFLDQFGKKADFFHGLTKSSALEMMKISSDGILNLGPEKISMQLTSEGSIFYTFFKNGSTFYLQHYLITESEEDEAFLNIFNQEGLNKNFAGDISNILDYLNASISREEYQIFYHFTPLQHVIP
jgi:hypothetical protein